MRPGEQLLRGRWPWFTTLVLAALVVWPVPREILAAAWRYSVTDWFRDLWVGLSVGGVLGITLLFILEMYVRRRMQRRGHSR